MSSGEIARKGGDQKRLGRATGKKVDALAGAFLFAGSRGAAWTKPRHTSVHDDSMVSPVSCSLLDCDEHSHRWADVSDLAPLGAVLIMATTPVADLGAGFPATRGPAERDGQLSAIDSA